MKRTLTVALIGERTPRGDILPRAELMRPYADRLSVTLEVDDHESVQEIASRGARELGLEGWAAEPRWLGFYRPEDATSVPPEFALAIPAVDEHGKARWVAPPHDVPYSEVLRAANEGFLYGDPARLHIALVPPVGDGVLPDWPTIVHALEILKTVGEVLVIPGGVAATWGLFKSRLGGRSGDAAAAIDAHSPVWSRRGADPYAFEEWLAGGAWRPAQIASHLECSEGEAEAILWAFGFSEGNDGRWRRGEEETAKFLADNVRMMIRMSIGQAEDRQLREEFARRAQELIDTGKAPTIDWQELNWLKPSSPVADELDNVKPGWWAGRGHQLGNWLRRRFR
jgi:hypothetical protein